MNTYQASFPLRKKKIKTNNINAPWCSRKLKLCIKKQYKLYNYMKRGLISRRSFRTYKNMLTFVTNKMRRLYYIKKFMYNSNDAKKHWKNINDLLNRKQYSEIKEVVNVNGQRYKGNQLPDIFNDYFMNVVSTLINHLPIGINYEFMSNIPTIVNSCFFVPCTYNEVDNVLKFMGNKGNTLNDITFKHIRLVANKIIPVIVYLFNICIEAGIYPDLLKVARVIPVHKSGSCTELNNYRPISTLICLN